MRWIKYLFFIVILGCVGYFAMFYTQEEQENHYEMEQEVGYPVEKVFSQFENFQHFTRWNGHFSGKEQYSFNYFQPYEGVGSSMTYQNIKEKDDAGEIFIRYIKPNKEIRYDIYKKGDARPYKMLVKFLSTGEKTKIQWRIETPKETSILRKMAEISENNWEQEIILGTKNMVSVLSGKVDQEILLGNIKYDSIIIEDRDKILLLGINTTTNNKRGMLYKNVGLTHNKTLSFITKDLAKRDDEFGLPMLITEVGGIKGKDVSYFYGMPVSKQEKIEDNNFVFKSLEKSKVYSIYYKGNYDQRTRSIDKLLKEIKKDTLRNGMLEETFIQPPMEGKDVILKLSLPVSR